MTHFLLHQKNYLAALCCIWFCFASTLVSKAEDKIISTPEFSVEHGFYQNPFDLVITSKTAGASIRYTLDGSDPRTSVTAHLTSSPVTININPTSTEGRGVTPAVVVRAVGVRYGYSSSKVVTKTYIFVDKVKTQSYPGHDWPEFPVNNHVLDYAIDQEISVLSPLYSGQLTNALLDIPSISIVTDNKSLFSSDTGIYVNPGGHGRYWERSASVELINPDETEGFQIDAGLRIRGGYSRQQYNPKHAFRLFFRAEYGESKLRYPLFEDEGVSEFDNIDLRTSQNYSWAYDQSGGAHNTFVREVFSRDMQREMGQPYTRSRYYHLYVNGLYWGLFQTQERSESSYAESYFGDDKDDYDVIKVNTTADYIIEATDGNMDAWTELYDMSIAGFGSDEAYYKAQGLNPDGSKNSEYPKLLDVDNLIDYMISTFYTGDGDGPVSSFIGNTSPNNFYAIYNRSNPDGFKFFRHDAEHSMGSKENVYNDRTGPYDCGSQSVLKSNPQWFHQQLVAHPDYVARFADRVNKYFFNDGLLTPDSVLALFQPRIHSVENAIIAESARWGDAQRRTPYTKEDWQNEIDRLTNEYVPLRTDIVIDQFKNKGWFTDIMAPIFKIDNTIVLYEELDINDLQQLVILNPNSGGLILYTTSGNDPRLSGGSISADAITINNSEFSLEINRTSTIKVRIKNGDIWSALRTIKLIKQEDYSNIKITEIHYHPSDMGDIDGDLLEFIEFKNTGSSAVNMTLCSFTNGINYTFSNETLVGAGEYLVLASNKQHFAERYPGIVPDGEYQGNLNNGGEKISLVSPQGDEILSVKYSDSKPWPKIVDGAGFSLSNIDDNPVTDPNLPEYWGASSVINGTPGTGNAVVNILPVLINEILSNSDTPNVDAVELYNPNNVEVNIGNWYLTDNYNKPTKWKIPAGTIIPANGYRVFNEGHYTGSNLEYASNEFGSSFSFSSHGENVYIFSADASGNLSGYSHGYSFEPTDMQRTFGRYITSINHEHFVLQAGETFGNINSAPLTGPVVINKIMYQPTAKGCEFIELVNISNQVVNLFDSTGEAGNWKVKGIDFDFPDTISMQPNASIYLIEKDYTINEFRLGYALSNDVQVFNFDGKLNNDNETITLIRPSAPYTKDGEILIDEFIVDKVSYSNDATWPNVAANGYYLQKTDVTLYGNDPANWTSNTIGLAIAFDAPKATEGVMYYAKLKAINGQAPYTWDISADALPENLVLNTTLGEISGIPSLPGFSQVSATVTDAEGITASSEFVIEVLANSAPVAMDDDITIDQNKATHINILENDVDNDGDMHEWAISIITPPQNGTALVDTISKTIFYTPDINISGSDQIEYQLSHLGKTSNATISITIRPFDEGDFNALVAIYKALNGDNWVNNSGWNTEINNVSNDWYGVEVYEGRVVGLSLVQNNLDGALPAEIGNLTALQYLELVENPKLSGEIPHEIGNLTDLYAYVVYSNTMSGEIPVEFGKLYNLQYFIVGWCNISGNIPKEFGNLTNLIEFYLFSTDVSGDVPTEFTYLSNLKTLWLSDNYLTSIPDFSNFEFYPFISPNDYTGFSVRGNNLRFDDIEPNLDVLTNAASYNPQKLINIDPDTVYVSLGGKLSLSFELDGVGNEYQWFTGNTAVSEKSASPDFSIANVTEDDVKKYRCKITNASVPDLVLTTVNITVISYPLSVAVNKDVEVQIFADQNIIHFTSDNGGILIGTAEIYDMSGKKVMSRLLTGIDNNKIETQNLKGGYIVRLITREKIYTEKLIIW